MTDRPILFSASMVRAILAGTQTQTRRALKVQPPSATIGLATFHHPDPRPMFYANDGESLLDWCAACPYGATGDRLWVREAHAFSVDDPEGLHWRDDPSNWDVIYRADEQQPSGGWRNGEGEVIPAPWRPSIHMPRWASRITLEITGVRVERLQAISEADAQAEGCTWPHYDTASNLPNCPNCGGVGLYTAFNPLTGGALPDTDCEDCNTPAKRFRWLWESINGAESWGSDPWVWVVEFKRLEA